MSDDLLPGATGTGPVEATGVSKGGSSGWSFESALADAIAQLGSSDPGIPDWLDTYTVTDISVRIGGVAGFNDLVVTVRRGGDARGGGITCRDWYAAHDHQPPGPKRLYVTATCEFPGDGYEAELRRAEPQGINPSDLILDLVITGPDVGTGRITTQEIRFEEEADTEYESVTVRSDRVEGASIQVEHVH